MDDESKPHLFAVNPKAIVNGVIQDMVPENLKCERCHKIVVEKYTAFRWEDINMRRTRKGRMIYFCNAHREE